MIDLTIGMPVEWEDDWGYPNHSGRIIAFDNEVAVVREDGHANTVFVDRKDLLLPDTQPEE